MKKGARRYNSLAPAAFGATLGDQEMQQVGMAEIEKIFAITDPMGIHRESVMIPLGPRNPGSVKRKPNGKFEIVVDASMDFDVWLGGLESALRAAGA
jgi:hypothetical protein